MGLSTRKNVGRTFANILQSDATIRVAVDENTPGAERREYTNPKTREDGVKFELVYNEIEGLLTGIEFKEFGSTIMINFFLSDVSGVYTLSISANSRYADDIMKKLPNCDFSKKITFAPFKFTPSGKEKDVSGVTLYQEGNKITNYYFDHEKKEVINNFPVADWDKLTTIVLKRRFFEDCSIFLIEETKKLISKSNFPSSIEVVDNDLPHFDKVVEIKKEDSDEELAAKLNNVEFED